MLHGRSGLHELPEDILVRVYGCLSSNRGVVTTSARSSEWELSRTCRRLRWIFKNVVVHRLHLDTPKSKQDISSALRFFPNTRSLRVTGQFFNESVPRDSLSSCKHLRELWLGCVSFAPGELSQLAAAIPNLEVLTLDRCLPRALDWTAMFDDWSVLVTALAHAQKLRKLQIFHMRQVNRLFSCSSPEYTTSRTVRSLEELVMRDCGERLDGGLKVEFLSRLPHLRSLDLAGSRISENSFQKVMPQLELQSLNVAKCGMSVDALLHLPSTLTRLTLAPTNGVTAETGQALPMILSPSALRRLSSLTQLCATSFRRFSGWRPLEDVTPNLRVLDLRGALALGDDGVCETLGRLTRLRCLRLERTRVGDGTAGAAAKLPHLQLLDLSATKVSSIGIDLLTAGSCRHSLRTLLLNHCRLEIGRSLRSLIGQSPQLTRVETFGTL